MSVDIVISVFVIAAVAAAAFIFGTTCAVTRSKINFAAHAALLRVTKLNCSDVRSLGEYPVSFEKRSISEREKSTLPVKRLDMAYLE